MAAKNVVIVGGGISGLTAAYRLKQIHEQGGLNITCTVCEADSRFGGKIHTETNDDYLFELGPDSIYTRKQGGVELITELGLEQDIVPVQSGGGTLILKDGQLLPLPAGFGMGIPSDLAALVHTDLLSTDGKRRALEDLLLPTEEIRDDISLGEFLRARFGNELVDTISTPLLAGIHAGQLDRMSLEATMPVLKKLFNEHGSLLLGALAIMKNIPASTGPSKPMFINLKGGLTELVEVLVQAVREFATLRSETKVTKIQRDGDGRYKVTFVQVNPDAHFVDNDRVSAEQHVVADAVLFAVPAYVAGKLLEDCGISALLFEAIRYASTATITFGFDVNPGIEHLNTSGYLIARTEDTPVTALTVISNKWSHSAQNGNVLLRAYVGHDGEDQIVESDDSTLIQVVSDHLERTLGIRIQPDFVRVKRWRQAMPQYDVGHLERVLQIETALAELPGITIAGAAYSGVGIPDCIQSATRAVNHISAYLKGEAP